MCTETCTYCGQDVPIGDWPFCPHGRPHGGTLLSAIHASERTVVYRNPGTGEIRYPARADVAVPDVYVRQGYVRQELTTHADVKRFEKETGKIHERSHYDPGSGRAERENCAEPAPPAKDPEVTRRLVQALR